MSSSIVRYKKGKKSFEILVKPNSVRQFLSGKLGWDKVLSCDCIFVNSKKGNIARSQDLISTFGSEDINVCAQIMIREGQAQVSASERKEDTNKHRQQILSYLHRTYTDQIGLPHPIARLESALEELKLRIDPAISVYKHAAEVIKKMQGKLVFKKSTIDYMVSVPKIYSKSVGSVIHKFSPLLCGKHRNRKDGKEQPAVSAEPERTSWKVSISSGDFDAFLAEMNGCTEGDFTVVEES